ncbi:MAG: hypothetical protein FJY67_11400 [Calditrichaeota bacterium]|nr:hypothetical protein [Calditrichota bacterium]
MTQETTNGPNGIVGILTALAYILTLFRLHDRRKRLLEEMKLKLEIMAIQRQLGIDDQSDNNDHAANELVYRKPSLILALLAGSIPMLLTMISWGLWSLGGNSVFLGELAGREFSLLFMQFAGSIALAYTSWRILSNYILSRIDLFMITAFAILLLQNSLGMVFSGINEPIWLLIYSKIH